MYGLPGCLRFVRSKQGAADADDFGGRYEHPKAFQPAPLRYAGFSSHQLDSGGWGSRTWAGFSVSDLHLGVMVGRTDLKSEPTSESSAL